jgi:hypothetical protein
VVNKKRRRTAHKTRSCEAISHCDRYTPLRVVAPNRDACDESRHACEDDGIQGRCDYVQMLMRRQAAFATIDCKTKAANCSLLSLRRHRPPLRVQDLRIIAGKDLSRSWTGVQAVFLRRRSGGGTRFMSCSSQVPRTAALSHGFLGAGDQDSLPLESQWTVCKLS